MPIPNRSQRKPPKLHCGSLQSSEEQSVYHSQRDVFSGIEMQSRLSTYGTVLFPNLNAHKKNYENTEDHEKSNNTTIAPSILGPTPLKGKQKADDGWHEKQCAKKIELPCSFLPCQAGDFFPFGSFEE